MKSYRFKATIEAGRGGGAWVTIPLDIDEAFGTRGQVKVAVTFDGAPYRGSLAPMGGDRHVLGIRKSIRQAIGKGIGDRVDVELQRDTQPRTVDPPDELKNALAGDADARKRFDRLSYTNQREYAEWVGAAKKPETRLRRADKAIEKILQD